MSFELRSGGEGRWTGTPGRRVVVCVNGGTAAEVPGTWSASVEWLVGRLARRLDRLAFLEVRYRTKSWRQFDRCVEDGAAALAAARETGAEEVALLAFSMGGAVAVRLCVSETQGSIPLVAAVNPWLPPQLELEPLAGRRLAVIHGSLDAPFPGVPGVKPSMSSAAAERARELGADVVRRVLPGGFHAVALRGRRGRPVAMPRAAAYADFVGRELERFCA
jgi:dienelactone hydrolase